MRTKVEKRGVRRDPPSILHDPPPPSLPASSEGGGSINSSAALSSASFNSSADRHDLSREVDRRHVSISEAERLAAANHVVVALGPPVIVGPSRVMYDGKGEAGGGGGGGVVSDVGGVGKPFDSVSTQMVNSVVPRPEEKAIKKPPKKRRNNDKKLGDVALDLSTTSVMHVPAVSERVPPSTESILIPAPVPVQLQQPPITPPTPSPQHQSTSSPQHNTVHSTAFLCRSPPNPAPLLQQTPPSSSEPVMMDTGGEAMEGMASDDVGHSPPCGGEEGEGSAVTRYALSDSESHLVLPSSLNLPTQVSSPGQQPEAAEALEGGDGEGGSTTSTSLLQPPTWLLTPQEQTPGREGAEHQHLMAASSNQRTAGAEAPPPQAGVTPQSPSPAVKKASKKAAKNTTAKSKSAKSSKGKKEDSGKSSDGACAQDSTAEAGAVISEPTNSALTANSCPQTTPLQADTQASSANSGSTKVSPPKSEKGKKKPAVDDENSQERLAKIEDSINCVIARYVYDCDDVSKLDKLRQAAREAEAKSEADGQSPKAVSKKGRSKSSGSAKPTAANGPSQESKATDSHATVTPTESQPSANSTSQPEAAASEGHSKKKKPAAKKKKATESKSEDNQAKPTEDGVAQTEEKAPKKKAKKSKKAADREAENAANGKEGDAATQQAGQEAPSQPTKEDDAKPSPPKKKKKASKKKDSVISEADEAKPVSDSLPNGHVETMDTSQVPKPAKKRKSKPKPKKGSDDKKPSEVAVIANGSLLTDTDMVPTVVKEAASTGVVDSATAKCPEVMTQSAVMEGASEGVTQSAEGVKPEGAPVKPPVKPKPKKAKKRKSEDKDSSENKEGEGENKDKTQTEGAAEGETVKPPPKKKKKKEKEVKDGETPEPKKKKTPSKSKKAKQVKTNSDTTETNGLPKSEEAGEKSENSEEKPSESGEKPSEGSQIVSTGEVGTSTEDMGKSKSTAAATSVEKKVKKTLDEVICPDCGHKTRGQAALSRHMKKMHEKSVVLPYPCPRQPDCEYSASKVSLLARHMLTHSLYMCSRCQFTVDAKDKYEEHLQAEHNVKLDCKLCKKCNRYVKCDTVPMEQHLEVCQGPVPFTCDVCGKQFKYESSLKVGKAVLAPHRLLFVLSFVCVLWFGAT